jgi:hypothetical protein
MKRQRKLAIVGVTGALLFGAGTGAVLNLPSSAGATSNIDAVAGKASAATDPPADSGDTETTAPSGSPSESAGTSDAAAPADDGTPPADGQGRHGPDGRRGVDAARVLDGLVTDGTITEAQEDAIKAAIEANRPTPPDPSSTATPTERPDPGAVLKTSLDGLVADGTITQAQADAITSAVEAARPADGEGRGPGMGGRHGGPAGRGFGLDAAATAIGITSDELKTDLEAGKTIAEVATEKGVDVQTVIDAIVAQATTDITQRVTDMVNGVKPTPPADAPDAGAAPSTTTGS